MSIRNEIIAALDSVGALAQRNYSDNAPPNATQPYTVFKDNISTTSALHGDGKTLWWRWLGQLDYWFSLGGEDQDLLDVILDTLDGLRLTAGLRLSVSSVNRVTDPLYDAGHIAITLGTVRPR